MLLISRLPFWDWFETEAITQQGTSINVLFVSKKFLHSHKLGQIKQKLGILHNALMKNRIFIKILSCGFRLIQYLIGHVVLFHSFRTSNGSKQSGYVSLCSAQFEILYKQSHVCDVHLGLFYVLTVRVLLLCRLLLSCAGLFTSYTNCLKPLVVQVDSSKC